MKMNNLSAISMAAILAASMAFAGCQQKQPTSSMKPETTKATTTENKASMPSETSVHFAFDKSDLDGASKAILDAHAAWLNADANASITVEGNCDERGSREYNLALGQRRADSVRSYLQSQGVAGNRIDTVSFGEERPRCTASGEACWALNRRADIVAR